MSSLSEKSAFEAFARMEEQIDQSERQLKAHAEIDEEFTGDKLGKDFKELEKAAGAQDADFRLLQLKQQMGMLPSGSAGAAAKQLPAGAAGSAPATSAPATPSLTAGAGNAPHPDDGIETADVEEIPDGPKPS